LKEFNITKTKSIVINIIQICDTHMLYLGYPKKRIS